MSPRTLGRFTPDELGVLAAALTLSGWPLPLQVRQSAPTQDAQRGAEQRATAALAAGGVLRDGRVEPELEEALRTVARPVTSLDVVGATGPGRADLVRVLAAHRGGVAVLAQQLPGPSDTRGSDVVVSTTTWGAVPADLAEVLLATLPAAPPGRERPITLRPQDLRPAEGVTRSAGPTRTERDRDRLARLVSGVPPCAGQVGVTVRTRTGAVGRRVALRWFDVADDGRYLLDSRDGSDVRPCDRASLAGALAAALADEPVPGGGGVRAG